MQRARRDGSAVAPKKLAVNVNEEDFRLIRPQFNAAYATLVGWRLGGSIEELAWLIALRVIAATSVQLKEMGVYDNVRNEEPVAGPDDGGFF